MVNYILSASQKERGLFGIFLWEIWTLRNAILFDGSPKRADIFVKDVNRLWGEAAQAAGIEEEHQGKKLSGWVSPPPGTAKLNFDGAFAGSDRSGAGVIIRDSNSMVIGLRVVAGPLGFSARATEAAALREGLVLAKSCGISKLIVEGDAKILLEDVEKARFGDGPEDISEVRDSLLECIELIPSFDYIKLNWIRREVNQEMMVATVDNPSNATEWALAEMLNKPEMLKRATEEIDRVVGKERLVQESDLPQLNYVKACLREVFRLHPIAPFNVPHVSTDDATVAGFFIPKGSHILLSRFGLGRNPKAWDEPLKYLPERHMKEGSEVVLSDSEMNMISFSTGRRGCPAILLGSTITTMLFARLLQGFTWELPPNVTEIELKESDNDLFLAKPLVALAKPRLNQELYRNL